MNNIKKIYNVLNNKFEIIIILKLKYIMEDIKKIVELQNILLLNKIADDKFNDESDKKKFIDKYNKINYRKFKIINEKKDENILENYIKINNRVLKKQ